ncbi:MAG: DUF1571 domain-containing protein [Bacteroidetes bacterium]|nr:DUF1571 domain-containing protein [Bacteroidota bacterium]HET6245551.1 DUF1571 domain-containing protein [Bacteroidia bacterium]
MNSAHAQPTVKELVDKMLHATSQVKTLKYNSQISERIDGVLESGTNTTKIQVNPYKVYLNIKGAELLYIKGSNGDKALIKSSSIPYLNISLDPQSSILRRGQHHTIFELGFTYFSTIIDAAIIKAGKDFNQAFKLKGSIQWEGKDCYVVIIDAPDFSFIPYTVKKGENVISIAKKLFVSEYMIVELNPEVKDYYNVVANQQIKVPSVYAKKTVIYINKENFLPVVQMMFDDKGLFAKYEYRNLILNPDFAPEEFTKGYKDYNFW